MCSICGIVGDGGENAAETLRSMSAAMGKRGPDQQGEYRNEWAVLGHNRLAIIDPENGRQPMTRLYQGKTYTIVYNGELYNMPELTELLRENGIRPETRCDTEVVLWLYILFGRDCPALMNGIFAFAVCDESAREVFFARDRFGVKPLFYAATGDAFLFASEIKALLRHPAVRPEVDREGMWELLFLAPVRMGCIFKNIREIPPAHCAVWKDGRLTVSRYWTLKAEPCTDSRGEIVEKTGILLTDAIRRQLVSDVPLCTLLSGGLDSTIVSAVGEQEYRARGETLATYSFEYEGNRENFHSSLFQPESDDRYAREAAAFLGTDHRVLTIPQGELAALLGEAAKARDFPGQADIDSSLLYFCRKIKERHTVALSGECADEVFGGYPWFYRPEMLKNPFFPWVHDPMLRASLFQDRVVRAEEGYAYLQERYRESMAECPVMDSDSEAMRTSRLASWASVNYFMASLLERKDRMSMAASVEVRVPFADHRILEYVYNVPWEVKFERNVEKALLRNAMAACLPESVLHRKKSPYPKTQSPAYEEAVRAGLLQRLSREDSPLRALMDRKAFDAFLDSESETWFGQLMSKPQMLAWLLQFDIWAEEYQVEFTL